MDSTNFPIPYSNQGASDDAHTACGLLNVMGLFFEDVERGISADAAHDLLKVLDQARELLAPVCIYLDDHESNLEVYRKARRKHILKYSKGHVS